MPTVSQPQFGDVPVPKLQYSLRGLLIAITAFAIVVGAIFRALDFLSLPILVIAFFVTPILLIAGIVRNHLVAYRRAFSIGVLLASALVLPLMIYLLATADYAPAYDPYFTSRSARIVYEITVPFRLCALVMLIAAPVLGIICVAFRWGQKHADVSLARSRSSQNDD